MEQEIEMILKYLIDEDLIEFKCFDLLKQWRAEQSKMRLALGNKWHSAPNFFTTDDGRIMNPATGPKWFSEFLKKNGLFVGLEKKFCL